AVDAAQSEWMEERPAHDVRGLAYTFDLGGHHAAGAGFEATHHGRIIGRGEPHKGVEADAACRPRCFLDLLRGNARMLLVEPDRIEAAFEADDLDKFGMTELARAKDAHDLVLCEQFLDALAHGDVAFESRKHEI